MIAFKYLYIIAKAKKGDKHFSGYNVKHIQGGVYEININGKK